MYRYIFVFLFALGNLFIIGNFSLSFFLFNLLVFLIVFFPYLIHIKNVKTFFLVPIVMLIVILFSLNIISYLDSKQHLIGGKKRAHVERTIKKPVISRAKKKDDCGCFVKPHHVIYKKPMTPSLWKHPFIWYKYKLQNFYKTAMFMVHKSLYKDLLFLLLLLIYTTYLVNINNVSLSCAYSFLTLFILPAILSFLYDFFGHHLIQFEITTYSLLATIILLAFLKVRQFRV